MPELTPDQIKDMLHVIKTMEANIQNWTYVQVNAEWLPNKEVADALEQILGFTGPLITAMRGLVEIEAITSFDPIDLI